MMYDNCNQSSPDVKDNATETLYSGVLHMTGHVLDWKICALLTGASYREMAFMGMLLTELRHAKSV